MLKIKNLLLNEQSYAGNAGITRYFSKIIPQLHPSEHLQGYQLAWNMMKINFFAQLMSWQLNNHSAIEK